MAGSECWRAVVAEGFVPLVAEGFVPLVAEGFVPKVAEGFVWHDGRSTHSSRTKMSRSSPMAYCMHRASVAMSLGDRRRQLPPPKKTL